MFFQSEVVLTVTFIFYLCFNANIKIMPIKIFKHRTGTKKIIKSPIEIKIEKAIEGKDMLMFIIEIESIDFKKNNNQSINCVNNEISKGVCIT